MELTVKQFTKRKICPCATMIVILLALLVELAWCDGVDNLPLTATEHNNLMRFWDELGCAEPYCARRPVGTPCQGLIAPIAGASGWATSGGYSGPACFEGRVTRIAIGGLVPRLNGTFSSVIGSFDKLTTIELIAPWSVSPRVPSEIGRLTALTLLNMRGVHGLPSEIGQLTALTQIIVDGTQATNEPHSTIPSTIVNLKNLKSLQLSSMNLNGNVPDLSSMTSLFINVGGNELTGALRVAVRARWRAQLLFELHAR